MREAVQSTASRHGRACAERRRLSPIEGFEAVLRDRGPLMTFQGAVSTRHGEPEWARRFAHPAVVSSTRPPSTESR